MHCRLLDDLSLLAERLCAVFKGPTGLVTNLSGVIQLCVLAMQLVDALNSEVPDVSVKLIRRVTLFLSLVGLVALLAFEELASDAVKTLPEFKQLALVKPLFGGRKCLPVDVHVREILATRI